MQIIFNHTNSELALLIPASILAGVFYAGILYYRSAHFKELRRSFRFLMASLRFLTVTFISLLLLSPMIKQDKRIVERPLIIIAQDNSESLLTASDSNYYQHAYIDSLKLLQTAMERNYEVTTLQFGDEIKEGVNLDFTDKQTDISKVLNEIRNRYYNRNIGGVILASDGIVNKGNDPMYSLAQMSSVPVFTIAMGDTVPKKDAMVDDVSFNRIAYLGNEFPLFVRIKANELNGENASLTVTQGSTVTHQEEVIYKGDNAVIEIPLYVKAYKVGLQKITVNISTVKGEITNVNNSMDVFVEVLDSRQKILILANAPHPDISALSSAVETNQNYEITKKLIDDFDGDIKDYSLIILHQLPSVSHPINDIIASAFEYKIPLFFIFGLQTDYENFNRLKTGLSVIGYKGQSDEKKVAVNTHFTLFSLQDDLEGELVNFPPITVPFGTFKTGPGVNILLQQKIGNIVTDNPMVAFSDLKESKIGVIAGEGIWRWKLYDYRQNQSHVKFDDMVGKFIQYLAAKEDRRFFKVYTKNIIDENRKVILKAEVYNQAYDLDNSAPVNITVKDDEGKEYTYTFNKTNMAYLLDAGILPVGNYHYSASVKFNNKLLRDNGSFTVKKLYNELTGGVANHGLLYKMANESGGRMFYPNQFTALIDTIFGRKEITEVTYTNTSMSDLLNHKLLFFLLLFLLTAEWFLRKFFGGY